MADEDKIPQNSEDVSDAHAASDDLKASKSEKAEQSESAASESEKSDQFESAVSDLKKSDQSESAVSDSEKLDQSESEKAELSESEKAEQSISAKSEPPTSGPFVDMPIDAAIEAVESHTDLQPVAVGDLKPCSECETLLEPWQTECHNCGKKFADAISVHRAEVEEAVQEAADLEESFQNWLGKGNSALDEQNYGEAQACFLEALTRSKALPNSKLREIEVRKGLAKALEKLEKKGEATEQYMLLSQLNKEVRSDKDDEFANRARQLSLSTMDILSAVDKHASFRPPVGSELKLAPLYCGSCNRILLESEVYQVRKGQTMKIRCFCGAEGMPLVRSDAKHLRALKTASTARKRKSQLIQAASDSLPDGRNKQTAVILAAVLGGVGAHRFYLGEKLSGITYLLFCWTGVPVIIGWFEAINYSQMSRVTFNLTYNIEQVVARLPAEEEEEAVTDHSDVFSMDVSADEPDEIEDQFTRKETHR
ncbi:MAG TPA: NINE protein [Drouetiella sp.]